MIKGLTHSEHGEINTTTKYRGKISTGYSPNEGPNKTNHPIAAGFFRMLKEVNKTERLKNQKIVTKKMWIENKSAQEKLEKEQPTPSKTPRKLEIICLFKTPSEMWESSLSMYSASEGLLCKSHGEGTTAKYLTFDPNGERLWIDRVFQESEKIVYNGCLYKRCPDYIEGKCKPIGLLKCFPSCDLSVNPYRFETRSINTIIGIESTLSSLFSLLKAAHTVKQMEAKKPLDFDGFFGARLNLIHRKVKSGGREVYITDIMPTKDFNDMVMTPIKRGLEAKRKAYSLPGSQGSISLLQDAGRKLLEGNDVEEAEEIVPMDLDDQRDIAINFGTETDPEVIATQPESKKEENTTGDKGEDVAKTILNDDGNSPEKKS